MNYYPTEEEINSTISNATPADFVYLPEGVITTPIIIDNTCTIIGQETILDVSDNDEIKAILITEDCDISNIKVVNKTEPEYSGVSIHECAPSLSNINVTAHIAFRIESCDGLTAENLKAEDSSTGYNIKNSMNCTFRTCVSDDCKMGWNIEGSSSIVGDAYGSQELGLDFDSVQDLTELPEHTTIHFTVNSIDYQFTTTASTTYAKLAQLINAAQRVEEGEPFSRDYNAAIVDNDIRITSLAQGQGIDLERSATNDMFYYLLDKKEIFEIECVEAGNFLGSNLSEKYWTFSTHTDNYIVWYHLSGAGSPPAEPDTLVQVDISVDDTAETVAEETKAKISTLPGITISVTNNIITVTIDQRGDVDDASDVNTGFTINVIQQGEIGSFGTQIIGEDQDTRTDRSHNNEFDGCIASRGDIGFRLINANNNTFQNCQAHDNSNTGLWQMPKSYSNIFRGELFGNSNYAARNTDKTKGLHLLDVASTWWGHLTGPSGAGKGVGGKASNYIVFEPWLKSGTEPIQSYPKTRDWIWRMLGDPVVRVELSEQQITDCIEMALDRFMYYRDWKRTYEYIDLGEGQTEVMLPVHVTRKRVIEVSYSPNSQMFQQLTGAGEAFFLTYYLQQTGGTFASDFYLAMAYKGTMQRALGIHPTYEFVSHDDGSGNIRDFIRVYPRPSIALKVAILYARELTEQEADLETWIRRYALTYAKEQLGRIRSKFASVPGPTGEVTLDGAQLISEAQQEREQLEQTVIDRGEPLSFTTG